MSRIGKKTIAVPQGVQVHIDGTLVKVMGPKGELQRIIDSVISVSQEDSMITVIPKSSEPDKKARSLWGLYRSLINNMVQGVTQGYEKKLEIEGTGYRATVDKNILHLSLGFSHPIQLLIPIGLTCLVEKSVIGISGADKEAVGSFAAAIRKLRPVEPYKGKGVRYQGEVVRRKEGKKAAATAS